MRFENDHGALVCRHQGELLRIEAWGADSLRVRATMDYAFTGKEWALTEKVNECETKITVKEVDHWVGDGTIDKREQAAIVNGRIKAVVNFAGVITFYKDEKKILQEYFRNYEGTISRESRCLCLIMSRRAGLRRLISL